MLPFTWSALKWLEGPCTMASYPSVACCEGERFGVGTIKLPFAVLALRIFCATGSTSAAVSVVPKSAFDTAARLAASRASVRLCGTPRVRSVVFVNLSVKLICACLGGQFNVRAAGHSLRRVVHRSRHVHFFDRLHRSRRHPPTNRVVNRSAGLRLPRRRKRFAGIQDEASSVVVARRFSVEQIVRVHRVESEAVARVSLAIRPDRLIPHAGPPALSRQKIRVHTRRKNRQLRKASSSERNVLDQVAAQRISIRRVRLVHQRRSFYGHRSRNLSHH